MSSTHPEIEALSAFVDGEAPEWADHVAGCAACSQRVDELRAVAAAVGAPVEAPPAAAREVALTAALDDVGRDHTAAQAGSPGSARYPAQGAARAQVSHRRSERRWALPAAAAVVVGVLGFSALLAMGTRSSDQTTVAGPAPESAPPSGALFEGGADSSAAARPPADLGDVPDVATLQARARAAGLPAASPAAAGESGARAAAPTATAPSLNQRAAAPNVVGTRPCEEEARTREPNLREVVYFATARRGQVPAVVLGFATGLSPSPVTLLLLAQEGCAELLRASGP